MIKLRFKYTKDGLEKFHWLSKALLNTHGDESILPAELINSVVPKLNITEVHKNHFIVEATAESGYERELGDRIVHMGIDTC